MVNNTKVIRGGSWYNNFDRILRSSCRLSYPPTYRNNNIGLRLVGEMNNREATGVYGKEKTNS